jgi:N-acetylmuramoyl-L-alanine amidase
MNKPKRIIIHCSANIEGSDYGLAYIDKLHKKKGWKGCGYHKVIDIFGNIENGRPENQYGAHAYGNNKDSLGLVYIGGLDKNGNPKDTRTLPQITAIRKVVDEWQEKYNIADSEVMGHRDLSPDLDGDGIIEPFEWLKACPCFDVKTEL